MIINVLILVLSAGIPKPDLISGNVSIQAGMGYAIKTPDWDYPNYFLRPDFGCSIGQIRLYWGKTIAFVAGLELFRLEFAFTPVRDYSAFFYASELFMPQLGASFVLGSERVLPGNPDSLFGDTYVPRLDLVCGLSPVNIFLVREQIISPTLRVEAKLRLSRDTQIILENRNLLVPGANYSTLHLSLAFSLGKDIIKSNKEGE
jgi:hypothetical protein